MGKPWILDLFCCQGGAGHGYALAGFNVLGIDVEPQPRYPYRFEQADAVHFLRQFGGDFAAIHASPPCQGYSNAQRIQGRNHPMLIDAVRELLEASGRPWVIENVPGAPLVNPVTLCGTMFGLHTYRHRLFESSAPLQVPDHPEHVHRQVKMGRPVRPGEFYQAVGNFSNVGYVRDDLGVPWMNRDGIRECIPPAYARHVGGQLLARVGV